MVRRALFAAATVAAASANMMDVLEPKKLAPTECIHGCDDWTNHAASLWRHGKVPADAGNVCAQPGATVNTAPYGAWCYCKDPAVATLEEVAAPPPSWDMYGTGRCRAVEKQFGATPPAGFAYDANNTLYHIAPTTLNGCQDLCAFNLTDCVYASWQNKGQGRCYLAEWCMSFVKEGDYETWHNGAQPVPPAPTQPTTTWGYCVSPKAVPEQINIQIASPSSVVLSFVTFEDTEPKAPPTAQVNGTTYTGVTHVHVSVGKDRTYYMHFILVPRLQPRTVYRYRVQSGGEGAAWSDSFSFRSPYGEGETKIDIYGDMGIYSWNNIEWLKRDCLDSTAADLIVHMGDHAYNEGQEDEHRADGYMNGFQPVLAQCPWLPNVGNHEFYDGLELARYLDQTWQKWGPLPGASEAEALKGRSTATSALGYMLSAGNHHGAGVHGSLPSNTSRYFSVDFGLVHLVALDLNGYFGTDACGEPCIKAQLEWLKQDLAQANKNRASKPWVVAFSHFPLYCTGCQSKQFAYYESAAAEKYGNANKTAAAAWGKTPEGLKRLHEMGYRKGLRAGSNAVIEDFQPIFQEYGVDMYVAGHWHYYESLWPANPGKRSCLTCAEPTQKSFNQPKVTVHVTSGNGGPPGPDNFREDCPGPDCGSIPASRFQSSEFSYGQLIAHNATHITFNQYFNVNGTLMDTWTLYQPTHGPF